MNVIIMGCGRVGARLASQLEKSGNQVTVIDLDPNAFRRLPTDFKGNALVGNGADATMLRRANIQTADAFIALTQGDNRNIMAAQIAKDIFKVKRVVCRIYDPLRQEMYAEMGLESLSPTIVFADMLQNMVEGKK